MNALPRPVAASVAASVVLAVALTGSGTATGSATAAVAGAAAQPRAEQTVARIAVRAGLQVGPKHTSRPIVTVRGRHYAAPDPVLAELPQGSRVDLSYWRRYRAGVVGTSKLAARRVARAVPRPRPHAERERAGVLGRNDAVARSERITDVGVGRRFQAVSVTGRLSVAALHARTRKTREDQGSIPRATHAGIGSHIRRITVHSRIG